MRERERDSARARARASERASASEGGAEGERQRRLKNPVSREKGASSFIRVYIYIYGTYTHME